jgi:2-oxoglutarate dehydrogenase E1 component
MFCTGKIYYNLVEKREHDGRDDVAIVRLEQIYPLVEHKIKEVKAKYKNAQFIWVQEEPFNMGAWTFLLRWKELFADFDCVSRKSSASPASGFAKVHAVEQEQLVNRAFS